MRTLEVVVGDAPRRPRSKLATLMQQVQNDRVQIESAADLRTKTPNIDPRNYFKRNPRPRPFRPAVGPLIDTHTSASFAMERALQVVDPEGCARKVEQRRPIGDDRVQGPRLGIGRAPPKI